MIEFANKIPQYMQYIANGVIVIVAIIVYASITRGYRGFLRAITDIVYSKWSLLGFALFLGVVLYFMNQITSKIF